MPKLDFPHIYRVSQLNHEANALLSTHFSTLLVTGEISNLSRPSSGHLYFSLKDATSQIRCALFRFQHKQIQFQVENGQEVIVHAQVSLYEPLGDFQLIVSDIQLAGVGKLQIAFEQLKKELEKAGLFDEKNKKLLPLYPQQIGIITSPTAAALHDILKVLRVRSPSIPVIIYPTAVQGDAAAKQIVHAIKQANHRAECDVLIIARGGGSIEDLWPFNDVGVAHAIFNSSIPIITGIGHQTDFTIADFIADVRAPTPSAAAESVSPDRAELRDQLMHFYQRLLHRVNAQLQLHHLHLSHLRKRLHHPGEKLRQQAQQLDQLENNLIRAIRLALNARHEKMVHYAHLLETVNPLKILQRGFSITTHKTTGKIIYSCQAIQTDDIIVTRLQDGTIESVVQKDSLISLRPSRNNLNRNTT